MTGNIRHSDTPVKGHGHPPRCVRCRSDAAGPGYLTSCPGCGGMLDARYELTQVVISADTTDPLTRFGDLLPVPAQMLPTGHGIDSSPMIELPGAPFGVAALYLKWEGSHPTGSAKDPMAIVALGYLRARGVTCFVFTSTGNTTAAYARALAWYPEMTAHVFHPYGFPLPARLPNNLVCHHVDGDYVAAHQAADAFAREQAIPAEGGFFSIGRREGLKVAYLDALVAAPTQPTVVVQAISSGMGIVAAAKAARELVGIGRLTGVPRLVAAQQSSCAPMASAYAANSPQLRPSDLVVRPRGHAVATLLGNPGASYPYVRDAVRTSGGALVAVPEAAVLTAATQLEGYGLDPCYSSATAFGALAGLVADGQLGTRDVVLVNLTGSRRSAAGSAERVLHVRGAAGQPSVV